jgi:hypothetical protein
MFIIIECGGLRMKTSNIGWYREIMSSKVISYKCQIVTM